MSGGSSRSLMRRAGLMTVVALLWIPTSAFAQSRVGRPPASFGRGDVGILNYALTLEYLEAAFYNGATAANMSLDAQTAAFLKVVTADENAHVAYLKAALGAKAVT